MHFNIPYPLGFIVIKQNTFFVLFLLHAVMSPLSSITSITRFLAFSSGRRRESTSASRRLPHLRWDRCLGLARSVRFGFLGSTAKESAVVRFIPRAGLSAGAEALLHDAGAAVAILAGGYALVFGFNDLTRREVLQQVSGILAPSLTCMHDMNLADSLLDFVFQFRL